MTVYFINGEDGDDANDGLTPETAVQSVPRLISLIQFDGDSVVMNHRAGEPVTAEPVAEMVVVGCPTTKQQ
jgi:hypothetical protein